MNNNENIQGDNIQQQSSSGVGVNKGEIKAEKVAATINDTHIHAATEKPFKPIKYIPNRGTKNFVGRQDELIEIHEKLHENNTLAISAVSGMGGVGKTELAIQYAQKYDNYYPGGICWLNARGTSLTAEIIQFIQLEMDLEIPQKDFQGNLLSPTQQVSWCWQHWQPGEGLVLVVFDDVISLEGFRELLPALKRFRVLLTTRLRDMETNIEEMHLDVLSPGEVLPGFLTSENKISELAQFGII